MLLRNTTYLLSVPSNSSTFEASKRKVLRVRNGIVIHQNESRSGASSWIWNNPVIQYKNINQITIETTSAGRLIITVSNDEGDYPVNPSSSVLHPDSRNWICFTLENDDNPEDIPDLETILTEIPSGSHADLSILVSHGKVEIDDVEYTGDNAVPFTKNLESTPLKLTADSGYTYKYQKLYMILYGLGGKYATVDTLTLQGDGEVTINTAYPLGTDTAPYIRITATAHVISTCDINADNLTTYTINDVSDGNIESVDYAEDSSELSFKLTDADYHFLATSGDKIMQSISSSLYERYEVISVTPTEVIIKIIGVKNIIEFPDLLYDEMDAVHNPVVIKNFTGVSVISESQIVYQEPYQIKFQATDTANKTIRSVVANYGGTLIGYTIDRDGVVTIDIPEMNENLTITASAEDKYVMTFNVTTPAITFKVDKLTNKILFKKEGTFYRIIVNENQSSLFAISLQQYEKIVGLSIDGVTVIPLGVEVEYTWNGTSDFELVKKTVPQPTLFTMNLYQLNGEKNLVDKTNVISSVSTASGTLRTGCDIMNPIIEMEYDKVPDFNYVFIENFNRYYFVTDANVNENGLWTISLHVDVLMSFKDEIRANKGVIARNEVDYNPLIEDTQRLREKDDEYSIIDITTKNIFIDVESPLNSTLPIVLGVMGGK